MLRLMSLEVCSENIMMNLLKGGEKMKKNLLEAKMKVHCDNQSNLAEAIGISVQSLNRKLNGTGGAEFTRSEIQKIKERYNLTAEEIDEIFF